MAGDLRPYVGGYLAQRGVWQARQTLAAQQRTARIHAGKIEAVAVTTELALFSLAQLSHTEAQLVQMVPHAQGRLTALVNTATMVVGSQIAGLAREL